MDWSIVSLLRSKHIIIIEDSTHSIFTNKHVLGDYCVCSLRKWFPIADGGVLYSKNNLITMPEKPLLKNDWTEKKYHAMKKKADYLSGLQIEKKQFLEEFRECENTLDLQKGVFGLSNKSLSILNEFDIGHIISKRKNNVGIINKRLKKYVNSVAIDGDSQVPLFYSIFTDDQQGLRKYLIDKSIYCPIHWPLYDEIEKNETTVWINSHELSIPIDHRYDIEDMEYICNIIVAYFENRGYRND